MFGCAVSFLPATFAIIIVMALVATTVVAVPTEEEMATAVTGYMDAIILKDAQAIADHFAEDGRKCMPEKTHGGCFIGKKPSRYNLRVLLDG
jgi:hypothetical protein